MPLWSRSARSSTTAPESSAAEESVESGGQGKGRPTPKRREAEPRRHRPVTAPTSRREAYQLRRDRVRKDRRRMRGALVTGDERNLPPRDAGPVKRYIRDVVDARRGPGGWFLPAALLLLVVSLARTPLVFVLVQTCYLFLFMAIIIDSAFVGRRIRREVAERFGVGAVRGAAFYGIVRNMQVRRFRMPPPKVRRGEPPRS